MRRSGALTALSLAALGLGACGADLGTPTAATEIGATMAAVQDHGQPTSASVNRDLAAARAATARYQNYDKMLEAGLIQRMPLPCIEGQGYHYLRSPLDGTVSASNPEVLMYEPQKNGRMRLVGVEYVVPISAWRGPGDPELFGRHFHENMTLGIYALHVWIWGNNPAGMFADGNPHVTCDYAHLVEN